MKKNKKNIVYSTNPDFSFEYDSENDGDTLPPNQQHLRIFPDRKNRKGKTVTMVTGFIGSKDDLKALEKELKNQCGSGGSSKDGDILLQGNFVAKIADYLKNKGYQCKISGV